MNFLGAVYFFLPAGIANMAPPLAAKLFGPGTPVDFGKSWHGKRLFGHHKTWQGLIAGTVAGTLCFLLQQQFPVESLSIIDYSTTSWLLGAALGFGALFGDLVKSFFKRRFDVPPGKPWVPFDQIDYVIGGMLLSLLFVTIPPYAWITIFIFYFLMHLAVNILFYAIGFKKNIL